MRHTCSAAKGSLRCKACAAGVPPEPPLIIFPTYVIATLPVRTRNPNNGAQGNSRLAAIIRARERAGIRNATRLTVGAHIRAAGFHPHMLLPARVTITRLSAGKLDAWDGLGAACKPLIDGVADVFQLRDDNRAFTWVLDQRKVKRGIYGVEIRIERIEEVP